MTVVGSIEAVRCRYNGFVAESNGSVHPSDPPSIEAVMRIYFVGSHATGKTTMCRFVSRRYGLPMISEVARAVLAEMETGFDALRTDMDLVAEYQTQVFARQVAVEKLH